MLVLQEETIKITRFPSGVHQKSSVGRKRTFYLDSKHKISKIVEFVYSEGSNLMLRSSNFI